MRIKPSKSGNNSIYRFFLLSYVAILLLALSSSVLYAFKIYSQLLHENVLSKQSLLSSLQTDVENNLRNVKNYGNSLAFDTNLLLYIQHPDLYSHNDVMKSLAIKDPLQSFVLDSFLYLADSDEIVTSTIRMKADRFFNIMYQFDELTEDRLRQSYLTAYHFNEYLPSFTLRQYGSEQLLHVISYMQSLPISQFKNPTAQLALFLDADKLFSMAATLHASTASDVYILDKTGRLLYASPDAAALNTDPSQSFTKMYTSPSGIITSLTSPETGWQYLISTPYNQYYQQNYTTLLFLGGVFLVYLVGGMFLVRWMAKRSYRPVKDISDLIADNVSAAGPGFTEFDLIKHTLLNQIKSHKELRSALEAQQPIVLRDCLAHLIHGQVTNLEAIRQRLASLGVEFGSDYFLCAIVEIDQDSPYFTDSQMTSTESLALARLVVQNVGCELLEEHFECHQLDILSNQSLFILCLDVQIEPYQAMRETVEQLCKLLAHTKQQFAMDLLMGVSQVETGLGNLPLCYDEARKALEYSRFGAGDAPALFDQTVTAETDYYFPPEIEQQLAAMMRSGNPEGAHELLARLFHTNFSAKKISSLAARSFLYQLAATVQHVINSSAVALGGNTVFDEKMIERILNSSNAEHARHRLDELIDQYIPQHQERALNRTEKLVENIAEFIDAHIEEEWLDLNTLSQQFGITPQYVSNIFKKCRRENIKDYIAKRKLNHAKELLTQTDLPIREIAVRLGYANEISIIRLFRKYEGVTPGDFRNSHRA